jgi:signal transduction histidine kinase
MIACSVRVYVFLAAILTAIVLTSLYLIRSNRRLFAQLASLSEQRSELAQKLIATQESTLRYISRELHDEFGQILTAIGSMLKRAGNQAPEGSPLRADIREVGEIAKSTLDNVRTLSQALHPVMLDESGLESTLDWYIPTVERQNGIAIVYEKSGKPFEVDSTAGVHIYRIVQEALNNITRHAGTRRAWVRLRFLTQALEVEVEDHGSGMSAQPVRQGIGLVAMRERAELLGATLELLRPSEGGTLVRLRVPKEGSSSHESRDFGALVDDHALVRRGFRRILEDESDITVVGECGDGAESVKMTQNNFAAGCRHGLRPAGHERSYRHEKDS